MSEIIRLKRIDMLNGKTKPVNFVSCIIEKNVSFGDGAFAWYFTHICTGAKIGKNTNIGEKSYIGKNVIIGDNVKIGNNVNIYEGAIVKDNVFIGNNVSFTNVRKPKADARGRLLDTIIGFGVSIGANSTIVGGIKIGDNSIIADGAVVVGNVPENAWVNGNPGKVKIRREND